MQEKSNLNVGAQPLASSMNVDNPKAMNNDGQSVHSKTKISAIAVSDQDSSGSKSNDGSSTKAFVEEERPPIVLDEEAIK